MKYSYLLGDKYKSTANASSKDHKITKIHHFVAYVVLTFKCYIQHSNVATFEGSFECRTFIYAIMYVYTYMRISVELGNVLLCTYM